MVRQIHAPPAWQGPGLQLVQLRLSGSYTNAANANFNVSISIPLKALGSFESWPYVAWSTIAIENM